MKYLCFLALILSLPVLGQELEHVEVRSDGYLNHPCTECSRKVLPEPSVNRNAKAARKIRQTADQSTGSASTACSGRASPLVETKCTTLKFEVVEGKCQVGLAQTRFSTHCGNGNIPRLTRLNEIITELRPAKGHVFDPVTKRPTSPCWVASRQFEEQCGLIPGTLEQRISTVAGRIDSARSTLPMKNISPQITKDLLLCIMRQESDFNPMKLSNLACRTPKATDFGVGQIMKVTIQEYWSRYRIDSNPIFKEYKDRYGNANQLYDAMGDDLTLELQMMMLILNDKFLARRGVFVDAIRSYDVQGKDGYVEKVNACRGSLASAKNDGERTARILRTYKR